MRRLRVSSTPTVLVLDLAAARRRRTRWRFVAAAAAVAAIAGGLFGGLSSTKPAPPAAVVPFTSGHGSWETVQLTSRDAPAGGAIAYSQQLWGYAFQVLVQRIPIGTTCQLWVVHPDGTRTKVASWTTARDEGTVWYTGSMPSTAEPIASFQITANNKVLLTATPA